MKHYFTADLLPRITRALTGRHTRSCGCVLKKIRVYGDNDSRERWVVESRCYEHGGAG